MLVIDKDSATCAWLCVSIFLRELAVDITYTWIYTVYMLYDCTQCFSWIRSWFTVRIIEKKSLQRTGEATNKKEFHIKLNISTRAYYSSHEHRSPISIHDRQYSSSARFLRKMRLVAIFTIDQQNQKLWCIDANNFCEVISHKEYHDIDRASIQCEPTKQPTEALESTIISHGMWGSHRFCPFWSNKKRTKTSQTGEYVWCLLGIVLYVLVIIYDICAVSCTWFRQVVDRYEWWIDKFDFRISAQIIPQDFRNSACPRDFFLGVL